MGLFLKTYISSLFCRKLSSTENIEFEPYLQGTVGLRM